uniref:Uncharacterized protein n=1 Tax=Oryza sativa subsp. japonica TaxID=39947 RepID=Q6ZKV5_ORYSJ|nr:hypothetical protein [Oryza sativa Japonica Group]
MPGGGGGCRALPSARSDGRGGGRATGGARRRSWCPPLCWIWREGRQRAVGSGGGGALPSAGSGGRRGGRRRRRQRPPLRWIWQEGRRRVAAEEGLVGDEADEYRNQP